MPQVLQLGPAKGVAGLGLDLIKLRENARYLHDLKR